MSQISQDFMLATEMQLIYDNIEGFEPVRGNLAKWKGPVGYIEGTSITVYATVIIPPNFPSVPPRVEITPKINHPNVDDNDFLSMRILAEWMPRYHVYQVINEIRKLFARVPAKPLKTKFKGNRLQAFRSSLSRSQLPSLQRKGVTQPSRLPINTSDQTAIERRSIEEQIIAYQSQIENINKEIEKVRTEIISRADSSAYNLKELSISVNEDLKAELKATNDLLEIIEEKFADGDLAAIDYLKLYKKYSAEGYKTSKKLIYINQRGESIMPNSLDKQLSYEADLYSAIVTLDNLARGYERGEIEQVAYKKQLRSLIRDIFKTRMLLEKLGNFSLENFVEKENLAARFDKGMRLLQMAEGEKGKDTELIPFDSLKRMPSKAADFVSAAIELIDLTRLKSVARADLVINDIDELLHISSNFPAISADNWMLDDMRNWKDVISKYSPSEILSEEDCEKLEFQASRWLSEFRRLLKDL